MRFSRSFFMLAFGLGLAIPAAGCAASAESTDGSASAIETGVHAPQADERKAIVAAFKKRLSTDVHGQQVFLNSTDPVGRFLAHGDWAYFEGVIVGADDNRTPIDYANSEYAKDFQNGFLEGVKVNGNFAAKFQSVAHKDETGAWTIATIDADKKAVAYVVGPSYAAWRGWASLPTPAFRDIFAEFPVDDLHEPAGTDRVEILTALKKQVTGDVHGQEIDFNVVDPAGTFLQHDGWAYLSGIVVGPNDNATAVDYRNSVYSQAGSAFQGVLHNNNFAATVRALFKKEKDGAWHLYVSNNGELTSQGYAVGKQVWLGDPTSDFAWDVFGKGNGNGNGDGDGDGDGG